MSDPFQPVARLADIPKKQCRAFGIGDRRILLAHTRDGFFAVEDDCPHAAARLSHGRLRGHRIICPLHAAAFDIRDGSVLKGPATRPLRTYPVRIAGDRLEVAIT